MVLLVKLFSVLVIVLGCVLILRPGFLRKMLAWVKEDKHVYMIGVIRVIVGILLVIASTYCRITWIVLFIGALLTFSGIVLMILRYGVLVRLIEWWETRPARCACLLGAVTLLFGVLLALAA